MQDNTTNYLISVRKKILALLGLFTYSDLIKNFLIYSFGSIILRSISILLAPITLTLLSPSDYGLLSLVMSFTNIFVVFLGLGLRQVFSIEFFHHDEVGQKKIINDILAIYAVVSVPLIILMLFNLPSINSYIFMGAANNILISISLLFCFLYFFVELFYQVLQYQSKALQLTLLQTSIALITISCNLLFLYIFRYGVEGLMIGYIIGMIIVFFIALYNYIKNNYWNTFQFKKNIAKTSYYLKLGFPFMPSILFGWILSSGNRWFLARYASLHDVGIYALADTFSSLYQMIILYPMSGAYLPYLFKKYADNKHDLINVETWNKKNMHISMLCMAILITLGYIACKPLAYKILPIKYYDAINYVWLILISNIFLMGTYFASSFIQYHKKTYFLAFALCIPALINIMLNFLLVKFFAIYGCVIASLFSYISYFMITLFYNNYLCKKIMKL
jgi:O-antigen/teichoic acid export membrane protein